MLNVKSNKPKFLNIKNVICKKQYSLYEKSFKMKNNKYI